MPPPRYVIFARDALGNPLDITGSTEGESLCVDTHPEILEVVRALRSGVFHDWDAEIHERKRIAWFACVVLGHEVGAEVFITPWGQKCNVRNKAISAETKWGRTGRQLPVHWITNLKKRY